MSRLLDTTFRECAGDDCEDKQGHLHDVPKFFACPVGKAKKLCSPCALVFVLLCLNTFEPKPQIQ